MKNFDDIEDLLQTEANAFEMYPSDGVWNTIANTVQEKKRWPALTIATFIIVVALSVSTFLNYPPDNLVAKIKYRDSVNAALYLQELTTVNTKPKENFIEVFINKTAAVFKPTKNNYTEKQNNSGTTFNIVNTAAFEKEAFKSYKKYTEISPSNNLEILPLAFENNTQKTNTDIEANLKHNIEEKESEQEVNKVVYANGGINKTINKFTKTVSKWNVEFYFTPSFSYRKLIDENNQPINSNGFLANTAVMALNLTTPLHELIRHKPALGFEVGTAIGYKISPSLMLTSGLQFNMRKYYIDAFVTENQVNIATINNGIMPIRVHSGLSNNSGNIKASLNNQLYQLSVPIGLNWQALQYKKLSLHIAATIQPTITLNKNIYLLSTDYKYYAEGEGFLRSFNINSAADVRFQYNTKRNGSFYVGPQLRFQHLPTYNNMYSIKEYRWDYGVRLGFIKQLRN